MALDLVCLSFKDVRALKGCGHWKEVGSIAMRFCRQPIMGRYDPIFRVGPMLTLGNVPITSWLVSQQEEMVFVRFMGVI